MGPAALIRREVGSIFADANLGDELFAGGLALAVEKTDAHGQPAVRGSEPQLDGFLPGAPHLLDRHGAHGAERRFEQFFTADFKLVALELPTVGDRQLDAAR